MHTGISAMLNVMLRCQNHSRIGARSSVYYERQEDASIIDFQNTTKGLSSYALHSTAGILEISTHRRRITPRFEYFVSGCDNLYYCDAT